MSLRLIHFYNFYLGIINWNKEKSDKLSFLSLNFKKKLYLISGTMSLLHNENKI